MQGAGKATLYFPALRSCLTNSHPQTSGYSSDVRYLAEFSWLDVSRWIMMTSENSSGGNNNGIRNKDIKNG